MAKGIKNEKVISNNSKGGKEKIQNQVQLKKSFCWLNNHKLILILSFILLIFIVLSIIIIFNNKNTNILTINDYDYNKNDYMMYFYSAKYNYYGNNLDEINDKDLKVMYDDESNITVEEYLKNIAITDIKTASAIKKMAYDNNISLSTEDYSELEKEKIEFINSLGGKKEYNKFLKENDTNDEAYDNMSLTDKLYKKILDNLYSEGKANDLTEEELEKAKNDYPNNYFKIKQIILPIIDLETKKNLSSTIINQKDALSKNIVELVNNGEDFDELIKKYSEAATNNKDSFELYYKKGELLSELENEIFKLNPGEVSKPIKTKYAYHIIMRLKLDDSKLNNYYDELREEKCVKDLQEYIKNLKIIYHDAYEKI